MLLCGAGCCLWTRRFSGRSPAFRSLRRRVQACGPSGALHAGGAFAPLGPSRLMLLGALP